MPEPCIISPYSTKGGYARKNDKQGKRHCRACDRDRHRARFAASRS